MLASNIALYVGAPIEDESERAVLNSLIAILMERDVPAVVFANLQIGGRQLDFVVGTDQLTLVIEAKASAYPLRGQYNGEWEALSRAGRWKPYRNAYLQALQAKNALRDAMRMQDASLSGYPHACVMFAPHLPSGSDLPTGDFKVSLGNLDDLATQIDQHSALHWSLECWYQFAEANSLQRISDAESAFDTRLRDAQRALIRYTNAFTATYGPMASRYVSDTYRMAERNLTVDDIEVVLKYERQDLLILGPSGCGKSLLSLCLANRLLGAGIVPVIVDCKSFDGQLATSLDREATLLDMRSASELISATRRLSRQFAVFIDGYNECQDVSRVQLTRALRAASVRYNAVIVITSQNNIERSDLLQLRHVSVELPGSQLKARIANVDMSSDASLIPLLEMVTTGIEADLVGQIGREIPQASSRFSLFDYFVRRKLGGSATDGIRLLCAIAKRLVDRTTFSLSVREVDRLLAEIDLPTLVLQRALGSGVLGLRGDRVSLCHEMYLNAFAAEAIIREVGSDADAILAVLSVPRYSSIGTLILGAIDDELLLAKVLSKTSDGKLLESCLIGECGSTAHHLVASTIAAFLPRLMGEVAGLRFEVTADGWWNVAADPESLTAWSERDYALMSVLALGMGEGRWIKEVLGAVKRMDVTLTQEFCRLRPEAAAKQVSIHSGLFAVTYILGPGKVSLTHIVSILHGGSLTLRRIRTSALSAELEHAWLEVETPGQLYFALALSRLVYETRCSFAHYVLPFLQLELWKLLPYHVHLDLLDYAHTLREVPEHIRMGYIDALQALLPDMHPLMSQTVYETLSGLGALREEENQHTANVRQQISELLSAPSSIDTVCLAWGIYSAQFDHPFSGAYVQALEELATEERLLFLRLACEGAEEGSFFLSSLLNEIARSGDRLAASSIIRWAQLPTQQVFMPQQAIGTFVAAFVALGVLAIDLPIEVCRFGQGVREDALLACGILYYWLQRREENSIFEERQAVSALKILLQSDHGVAAGVIYMISKSVLDANNRSTALVRAFPEQVLTICRAALERPDLQSGYFERSFLTDQSGILNFAINVIGRYGSVSDLVLLRPLIDDVQFSVNILEAVKIIEMRGSNTGAVT